LSSSLFDFFLFFISEFLDFFLLPICRTHPRPPSVPHVQEQCRSPAHACTDQTPPAKHRCDCDRIPKWMTRITTARAIARRFGAFSAPLTIASNFLVA